MNGALTALSCPTGARCPTVSPGSRPAASSRCPPAAASTTRRSSPPSRTARCPRRCLTRRSPACLNIVLRWADLAAEPAPRARPCARPRHRGRHGRRVRGAFAEPRRAAPCPRAEGRVHRRLCGRAALPGRRVQPCQFLAHRQRARRGPARAAAPSNMSRATRPTATSARRPSSSGPSRPPRPPTWPSSLRACPTALRARATTVSTCACPTARTT